MTGQRKNVVVVSPSRLHFGLLQLSAEFTTLNMGIGACTSRPRWVLSLRRSSKNDMSVRSSCPVLADDILQSATNVLDRLTGELDGNCFALEIMEGVPSHKGLGSKTSLLCGIIAGAISLDGRAEEWPTYLPLSKRGGTSGIGYNTAVRGGFLLDSGHFESPGNRIAGPSRARVPHALSYAAPTLPAD